MSDAQATAWVQALASSGPLRDEAYRGLLGMGEAAVPHLIAALPDRRISSSVTALLAELGPAAQAAIPALLAHVRYVSHEQVAAALVAIGAPAVPAVIGLLDPQRPEHVRCGLDAVARLGATAREAVLAIVALFDRGLDLDELTSRALAAIGDAAVPHLLAALRDRSPRVRRWAIRALGELRRPTTQDALIAALGDAEVGARAWAARALGRIGGLAALTPTTLDGLIAAFEADRHPEVRRWIAWALGEAARATERRRRRYRHAPDPALVEHLRARVAPRLVEWLAVRDAGVHGAVVDAVLGAEPLVRGGPGLHAAYVRGSRLRALLRRQAVPELPGQVEPDDEADDDARRERAYAVARLAGQALRPQWYAAPPVTTAAAAALAAERSRLAAWMEAGRIDVRFACAVALWAMTGYHPDPARMTGPLAPLAGAQREIHVEARWTFDKLREGPPGHGLRRGRPY